MPLKVTDYSAIEDWIRHVNAGDISYERPAGKNNEHSPESKTRVWNESCDDNLPERSPTSCVRHTARREVVGTPVVHESRELDTAHIGENHGEDFGTPTAHELSEEDKKLIAKVRERVSELEETDLFEVTHDEMILGVVDAHTRAHSCLRELQRSCVAIQTFRDDLYKKMFEAERTGQLEGNISEEWRLYSEIIGHIDDYFLRRPDLMRHKETESIPEFKSHIGIGMEKNVCQGNCGSENSRSMEAGKDKEGSEAKGADQNKQDSEVNEDSKNKGYQNVERKLSAPVEAANLGPRPRSSPISLASWRLERNDNFNEIDKDSKGNRNNETSNDNENNEDSDL
jgi:hypothetical protein